MKGDDLGERFLEFSARIIKVANALPKTPVGRHVLGQIIRCGTSTGANYAEARGAESKADFAHKLGIVLKELRETEFWLQVVARSGLIAVNKLTAIMKETQELRLIIAKSIQTCRKGDA